MQKYSHMKNEKLPVEQRIPYSLGPSHHPARSRATAIPDVCLLFSGTRSSESGWQDSRCSPSLSSLTFSPLAWRPKANPSPYHITQHAHAQKDPTSCPHTRIQAPNELTSQRSSYLNDYRTANGNGWHCRGCCATRRGHAGCQHLQRVVLPQRELRQVLRCSRSVSAAPRHAISPCRSPVLRCADGRSSERRRSSRAARSWFASRTKRRGLARLGI